MKDPRVFCHTKDVLQKDMLSPQWRAVRRGKSSVPISPYSTSGWNFVGSMRTWYRKSTREESHISCWRRRSAFEVLRNWFSFSTFNSAIHMPCHSCTSQIFFPPSPMFQFLLPLPPRSNHNNATLLLTPLFTLSLFFSPATSHFSSTSHSSSYTSPSFSEWRPARATYYAAADPRDAVGGACGYGDLVTAGYGMATVGLSEALFERGQICGACFELRCVDDLRWCIPGTSIIVTETNFCAPNYAFTSDGGGRCNPPNNHFVLPIEAFEKIAIWKAGNMPVQYIRIKCRKEGGMRFAITGSSIFISVLISNVAGSGDVAAVKIKGSRTGWLSMGRNWGQNWHVNADLKNQPLSFEVTGSDGLTVTSFNVAPKNWNFGQTFEGKQFES